ncbi:MAG: P13 family porin [Spirochaetaceae bacterium]|nr:P13 family porin [Spirochaetaceae bacterium]
MRKCILVIVLCTVGFVCFADDQSDKERAQQAFIRVTNWLDSGLERNLLIIQNESLSLTSTQRINLFEAYEKGAGGPFALNFLLGFGIGSFVQGDAAGGWTTLLGEAAGIAAFCYGVSLMPVAVDEDYANSYEGYEYTSNDQWEKAEIFILGGAGLFIGMRIFEWIRPFVFAHNYNKTLKKALNYYNISYNLAPTFDIRGTTGVLAAVRINF